MTQSGVPSQDGPEAWNSWKSYKQKGGDDRFQQFLKDFLAKYDGLLEPLFSATKREAPHLAQLPDEMLTAMSCHLRDYRKIAERLLEHNLLNKIEDVLKCLCILCRNFDNIPFIASCEFVSDVIAIMSTVLHVARQSGNGTISQQSSSVLHFGLYFCECLYDPYFNWRATLNGQRNDLPKQRYSPALLHIEVVPFFYDCFQEEVVCLPVPFVVHCLHLFGAVLSGAKHNAIRASCPATLEVLLSCIGESRFDDEIRSTAMECLGQFSHVLLSSKPDQTQLDVVTVMEEFCKKWQVLCKAKIGSADKDVMIKILVKLQTMLRCTQRQLLQAILAQVGWLDALLDGLELFFAKISPGEISQAYETVIQTIFAILQGNTESRNVMLTARGYDRLLECLKPLACPTTRILETLLSFVCDEDFRSSTSPRVLQPEAAALLVRWLPLIESPEHQLWLSDAILSVCSRGMNSRMVCCEAGLIPVILSVLKQVKSSKATVRLIKLIENLGCYSLTPSEFKQLILLLRLDEEGNQFSFTTHLMHAMSTMAKRYGADDASHFFDFQNAYDGITVPAIAKWPGYGFTFHAWVRLSEVTHSGAAVPLYRRQLYSFCTSSCCGFEAFFLPDGILVIAVLTKKEYLTVSVSDHPINDSRWHSIAVCHSSARRPFMSSQLVVYIDGKSRLTSQLKCPSFSEPFVHCRIGCGGQSCVSSNKMEATSPTAAERLLSNLPIPSFLSLPLPLKSENSYGHGVTVLTAGMQDKVWGLPSCLQGQLGSACLFHESLQPVAIKCLHLAGPNHLMLFTGEDADLIEMGNKLVLFYHAKASEDSLCTDLSPNRQYDGHVTGHYCGTWDIKEAVSCVGGIQVLFPFGENAHKSICQHTPDVLISPDDCSVSEDNMDDWVVLPSSSYSEWKLEQNQAAGFLVLIRNFNQICSLNQDSLLTVGDIETIGVLLQKLPPVLVNVHLLMAAQLLLESTNSKNSDASLRHALYHHILFDFRIWSKSDFAVRIGHIQYISSIIKDDRKYFRRKYGVLFLLDVIRQFYGSTGSDLGADDCKAIRVSLLGLIRYFITRDINSKEMGVILAFLFSVKEEELLTEVLEMLTLVMEHRQCKDQIFLLIFEPNCIELLYCLLLNPIYSIQFRCHVLKLVTVALKSGKVYEKSKVRLRLQDVGLAGLVNRLEGIPVSNEMAKLLVDQVLMTDNIASYQGLLVLLYFIRFTDINLKLQAAKQVAQVLITNSNAPHLIAMQHAWHDCILQLLIKQPITGNRRCSGLSDDISDKVAAGVPFISPNRETFATSGSSGMVMSSSPKPEDLTLPPSSPRTRTSQYFRPQLFDFDAQSLENRSLCSSKASSLEDLSTSQSSDAIKIQENFTVSGSAQDEATEESSSLSEVSQFRDESLKNLVTMVPENFGDVEDELCQFVANIVFTVMWRGISGSDKKTWKERGQVFTCINILALSNQLYKSHLEVKRTILELILHTLVFDLKEAGQANAALTENAMEVMKWTYDFVVVDASQDHNRKLSGKLLDGVLGLLDTLMVFEEGPSGEEWTEMAQMGVRILLECAASENLEICAMATPKLHTLIQTRIAWSKIEEVFFLLSHLDDVLGKTVEARNQDHYSFIIPLVKALLETTGPRFHLERHLPTLPSNQMGPSFFEDFQQYCRTAEWRQFIEKHVKPIALRHTQQTVSQVPEVMNEYWNECCENTIVALHRRNREWGESRLRFQSSIMEPFSNKCIEEQMRYNNVLSQARNQSLLVRRRWRLRKLFLQGPRGPWRRWTEDNFHWKLSYHENLSRMRLKLVLNHHFDQHLEASRLRDNLGVPQPQPDSIPLAVAREALASKPQDDSLNEEDIKALTATEIQELELTGKEKLVMTEECELVVLMSVIKGRLELTTSHIYFFDSSPVKDVERYDFKFSLSLLREVHLRRYNLRRSALEFFLIDQTNYFLSFNSKSRNKVYSRILSLRPPNLFVYSSGSPAEVLKSSGFTQKWVQREISNFDYLMMLNTIAGRTYNDLSQYPVFPWILSDYVSETLDFSDPKIYRDLSKPVGVVNPNNVPEVKAKYDHFEDPTGLVEKFHYGTHYSNSAGVLHYLVRLEPFTSLHVELQSGRFDVADRQFHSIPGTWKMLMENPNDVKELTPEFFYLPEFLVNLNNFDLGRLQGSKDMIGDVVLPKWAKSAEDFIFKHRKAFESEYVSAHLHEWIDLIFGYKQKGPDAVEALNVFYYCSYEGAVNLDTISDPVARAAMEGMINNFGQTPCQLLKEPHPTRMSLQDSTEKLSKLDNKGINLLLFPNNLRLFEVEMSSSSDPVLFLSAPRYDFRTEAVQTNPDSLIAVTESGCIGVHNWLPFNKTISNFFTLDLDPTFTNARTQRRIPVAFEPGIALSSNLFVVTHDVKLLFSAGYWDNGIRVYKFAKSKTIARVVGHKDVVTCLAVDRLSRYLISGSRDLTCIIWDISGQQLTSGKDSSVKRVQILYGHDREVTCVAIMTELDMAVSGAKDGTINMHTVREGLYLRTLKPDVDHLRSEITLLALSNEGHIIASTAATATESKQAKYALHVYSVNGKHLWKDTTSSAITALLTTRDYFITGNTRGQLNIHELYELKLLKSLFLPSPIRHLMMTVRNTHLLASLQNGRLMVVNVALPIDLK